MPCTRVLRQSSAPFAAAFSLAAMPSSQGLTVPAVGAYRVELTPAARLGSIAAASSPVRRRSPGTPMERPFSYFFCKTASACGPKLTISEPQREKGTSSSRQSASKRALARTHISAFSVPGLWS